MSAFIMDPERIKELGVFFSRSPYQKSTRDEAQVIAAQLLQENIRSVEHRYPDSDGDLPGPIDFNANWPFTPNGWTGPKITPVVCLKLLDCLEYQSCETEDWEQTGAYNTLQRIRKAAISQLDGYEEAPWG